MTENKNDMETENKTVNNDSAAQTASAAKRVAEKSDAEHGDSVKETVNKIKDAAGQAAADLAGQAQEKTASLLDTQKDNLAAGINAVADGIRQIGEHLQTGENGEKNQFAAFAGQYGDSLAEQVEKISHYVEKRDFRELARDAEQFARRNPAIFVGGAFALGILAARFLKSSGSRPLNGKQQLKASNSQPVSKNTAAQA